MTRKTSRELQDLLEHFSHYDVKSSGIASTTHGAVKFLSHLLVTQMIPRNLT